MEATLWGKKSWVLNMVSRYAVISIADKKSVFRLEFVYSHITNKGLVERSYLETAAL
jgi:hypothetical protein